MKTSARTVGSRDRASNRVISDYRPEAVLLESSCSVLSSLPSLFPVHYRDGTYVEMGHNHFSPIVLNPQYIIIIRHISRPSPITVTARSKA
jgi:hypothetical protein